MTHAQHRDFTLQPEDVERLANLAGPFDEHLRQLEMRRALSLIAACSRCRRASATSCGTSSCRFAAGVPGRRE